MHWGDEIHTNVHDLPHPSCGLVNPSMSSANANLSELIQCCLQFLILHHNLICHVSYTKRPFRCQITEWCNAMIRLEIPVLGAGTLLVADALRLGILPDQLPHSIIFPLCCQVTLLRPNPMVSAAHWLTATLRFSAQMRTCRVSIWIVVASAMTDFGNQKGSHYILGTQWRSMVECWVSNVCHCEQLSRVLTTWSRVRRCGSRGL